MRLAWAKQQGLGHSGLHGKTLCQKIKKKNNTAAYQLNLGIPDFCVLEEKKKKNLLNVANAVNPGTKEAGLWVQVLSLLDLGSSLLKQKHMISWGWR